MVHRKVAVRVQKKTITAQLETQHRCVDKTKRVDKAAGSFSREEGKWRHQPAIVAKSNSHNAAVFAKQEGMRHTYHAEFRSKWQHKANELDGAGGRIPCVETNNVCEFPYARCSSHFAPSASG
eukprot:TRINITY_DN72548_c0_g1_i1.p2 TRINITY_DN72548_c0_g1~~TRINITY_DN72548_c0_g1_i1.p2  ORF type:complete len:123 (+),score=11.97 TRINITY_DN72548_c0_g1_i1:69-437(+)